MSHTERAREMLQDAFPGAILTAEQVAPFAALLAREAALRKALCAYVCAMDIIGEIASATPGMTEAELGVSMARIARQVEWARATANAAAPTEAPAPAEAPAVPVAWVGRSDLADTAEQGWCVVHAAQCDPGADHDADMPLYDDAALASARESGRREGIEQAATLAADYGTAGRFYAQAIHALP